MPQTRQFHRVPFAIIAILALFNLLGCTAEHEIFQASPGWDFAEKLVPETANIQTEFVDRKCVSCHRSATPKNRFVDLTDISALGPNLIRPGCPNQSFFLSVIKNGEMPPRERAPQAVVDVITDWILNLAAQDAGPCSDEPGD